MGLTNYPFGQINYQQALGVPNMTTPKKSGFLSALGGVASIAAPILGNVIGNIGRRKAEREARDYNHPAAQMARLQEAGLNPNLIYGSSPAQAAGTGQAPDYQMRISSQDILNTQTLRQITAQTQNIRAQSRLADMNAAAMAARIPGLQMESSLTGRRILSSIGQAEAATEKLKAETRSALIDANIKDETQHAIITKAIEDSKIALLTKTGKEYQNEIDKVKARLAENNLTLNDSLLGRLVELIVGKYELKNFFDK